MYWFCATPPSKSLISFIYCLFCIGMLKYKIRLMFLLLSKIQKRYLHFIEWETHDYN